ncbi:penicillin-binding protein [Candidatus Dojkabacteria bacterium]|uniref:peptidoglycan glycosyltransferase n=1 Tax=Candidatus Dojkabacteria bacterium TaxID=2099670 RepID=A0A5C7J3K2_9BACT|nr:MAG: penicillin-binding protein [Candidatus Dojkabacteria bacterium]
MNTVSMANKLKKYFAGFKIPRSKSDIKKIVLRYTIAVMAIGWIIVGVIFYLFVLKDLPDPRGLKNYGVIPLSSRIYDRKGELLYEIFREQNRTPVKLGDLPKHVPQATLAIEDANFYKHGGISFFGGVLRAAKDMVLRGKAKQGGSTITQQLVKSALLTPERTIQRKLKEAVLAIQIEQMLSKDQILELYLNQVPYGGVSYGIQEASNAYFDKEAKDLTLAEAALLAGLPAAPSAYNPFTHYDRARSRQLSVLKRMQDVGYITQKQREEAEKQEILLNPAGNTIKAPHFVFYVRSILEQEYGKQLVEEGGLIVKTTLDSDIQASAEAILNEEVLKIKRLKVSNGALLVTRPSTGEILSMVGSADFFATGSGTYNVTTAQRQPGSSIKPINYAIGIDRRIVTGASVFNDAPTCFIAAGQPKGYCPVNYDGSYRGAVTLRFALANSLNIPAVKMLAKNGVENFVASSSAFLIDSLKDPKRYGLSLTLGGGEVSMVEMAQAFSAFANEGIPRRLTGILEVTDKNGKVLYKYNDPNLAEDVSKPMDFPNFLAIEGKRAISKEAAFIISHILQDNNSRSAAFGPSSALVVRGKKGVSVKTGTTNDLRDNWTIGYSPNFLVAVWVGNNDNSPMSGLASGITGAAPIWNKVMSRVLENQPDLLARTPEGVVGKQECIIKDPNSQPNPDPSAPQGACNTQFEYFIKGTEGIGAGTTSRELVPVNRDTDVYLPEEGNPAVEMREHTVLWDGLSKYCLDCNHDGEPHTTVIVPPNGIIAPTRSVRREN